MGLGGAPPEAKVSPSSEAKEGGKEGRNEERKGMEEGKGVMGALFRADHGRPGKALHEAMRNLGENQWFKFCAFYEGSPRPKLGACQ